MMTPARARTLPPGAADAVRELAREHDQLREDLESLRAEVSTLRSSMAATSMTPIKPTSPMSMPESIRGVGAGAAPLPEQPSAYAPLPVVPPRAYDPGPALGAQDPPMAGLFAAAGGSLSASEQGIDFGAVSKLSPEALDALPYGLITLDASGRVLQYNDTESRLVGLPKERVIGRSFFGEVAPCTRVREFQGKFEELVRDPVRVRVQTFDFVFRFARAEHHVAITITPARVRGQFHVALVRRAILARSAG